MASSEFSLIQQYFAGLGEGPFVERGVGDDAATLRVPVGHVLHVSTDTALVDVHFPSDLPAADVAYRSLMAAASDLAAMGAQPMALLLSLTLPAVEEDWLQQFTAGLKAAKLETVPHVPHDRMEPAHHGLAGVRLESTFWHSLQHGQVKVNVMVDLALSGSPS